MAVPVTRVFVAFNLLYTDDYFLLNDTTKGVLDSVYTLGGDVFYDVTEYVESVSINRGKSRQLERYSGGTLSVTFHNESRIFDPFNSASPYFGQIQPRKAVIVETNGVRIFTGIIDDWDLTYDISGKAYASISAVDGFLILAAAGLDASSNVVELSSARINRILDRVEVQWPSGQREIQTGLTTMQADDIVQNQNVLAYLQLVESTENGQLFINKSGSVRFKNRTNNPTESELVAFSDEFSGDISRTNLILNPSLETNTTSWSASGGNTTLSRSTSFAKYKTASLKAVVNTTGVNRYADYFNSTMGIIPNQTYTYSCWVYLPLTNSADISLTLQAHPWNSTGFGANATFGTQTVVRGTWTRLSGSFSLSTAGGGLPLTSVLLRVINFSSWEAGQEIYIDGALLEETDSLNSYFDGSSVGANWTGTADASASEIPLTSYIPYTGIGIVYGADNLYNRVSVTRLNGITQTVDSVTSQGIYGVGEYSLDGLLFTTDTEASAFANYLVGLYDNPELRLDEVVVQLHDKTPAQVDTLIGLELGDLVRVQFTPRGIGDQINQYAYIIKIDNAIGIDTHTMKLGLASIDGLPFILDDLIYGVLDSSYILSY
jgi:hypothetical protein